MVIGGGILGTCVRAALHLRHDHNHISVSSAKGGRGRGESVSEKLVTHDAMDRHVQARMYVSMCMYVGAAV